MYQRHNLDTVQIDTPEQLVGMLHRQRIDFMEATLLSGLYLVQKELPDDKEAFEYLEWITSEVGLEFHSQALQQRFDEGLALLKKRGTYRKILENYWGKGNVPQASFLDMYPVQGVYFPDLDQFWRAPRDPVGRILAP
ncbi:MAG: transporter substrate-binding domain-containing protein [Motiliproteus sp.]